MNYILVLSTNHEQNKLLYMSSYQWVGNAQNNCVLELGIDTTISMYTYGVKQIQGLHVTF